MADQKIEALAWLPEQSQEDELHASRLLAVEERPFQRVTKKILGADSILRQSMTYLPSPPPDSSLDEDGSDAYISKVQKFRDDVLIDFANLESSLVRIQLILSSNERERERYAAEKAKILETAQAVRDNTAELRVQLSEAQRILEQRRGYDEEASKILNDKKLKSREETRADIDKLEKEIEDLQHESAEYETTWVSRKEHFDNIVREGEAMIRQIKGIKDEPEPEPEKDENMDDAEDGIKAETGREESLGPDGRSPQPADTGDATPMRDADEAEGGTPRPTNKFLEVDDGTRSASRASSPLQKPVQMQDDVDMAESVIEANEENQETSKVESMETTTEDAPQQISTPAADVAMDET